MAENFFYSFKIRELAKGNKMTGAQLCQLHVYVFLMTFFMWINFMCLNPFWNSSKSIGLCILKKIIPSENKRKSCVTLKML
jgi:hypothetical protein